MVGEEKKASGPEGIKRIMSGYKLKPTLKYRMQPGMVRLPGFQRVVPGFPGGAP